MSAPAVRRSPELDRTVEHTPSERHGAAVLRRMLLLTVAGGLAIAGSGGEPATSLLLEYRTRALAVLFVGIGAAGLYVGTRLRRSWGFEVVPAATGAIAAMALIGSLAGTPFGPGGVGGDQTFRTAAVTRFADDWHNADFTSKGLPSFYPPAYFWVLGRGAALVDVDPWRMLKVGAILTALTVPMVAFVLWRRIVPEHVAALISVVAIVVENFYEPYSWLVIVAFVPWWLEVIHSVRHPGRPPGSPILLGVIGALMLATYWYFFAVGLVALAVKLVADHLDDASRDRLEARHAVRVLAVAGVVSAVYWLPLALSVVRADHPESLGNRWFSTSHPELPLPMFEPTATGVVCLIGMAYLAWSYRSDEVARGLGILVVATYAWYLIGAAAASLGQPLLSFRGKPLIPLILLTAGVIALVRVAEVAATRVGHAAARVCVVLGLGLGVVAAQGFVDDVSGSQYTESARAATRPDVSPPDPSAADLQRMIESRVGSRAVLLSDRVDVLALFPNHSFVVWDAHYAHPASEFSKRIELLTAMSRSQDPTSFGALARHNPYDAIDAFVLLHDGDDLVFRYGADAFPAGTHSSEIRFPVPLFDTFDQIEVGDHVLIILR